MVVYLVSVIFKGISDHEVWQYLLMNTVAGIKAAMIVESHLWVSTNLKIIRALCIDRKTHINTRGGKPSNHDLKMIQAKTQTNLCHWTNLSNLQSAATCQVYQKKTEQAVNGSDAHTSLFVSTLYLPVRVSHASACTAGRNKFLSSHQACQTLSTCRAESSCTQV